MNNKEELINAIISKSLSDPDKKKTGNRQEEDNFNKYVKFLVESNRKMLEGEEDDI